jgi:hypothetical protein
MMKIKLQTHFWNSAFSAIIGLTAVAVLTACEDVKPADEANSVSKAANGFNGEWKTDLLKFDSDQCAFRMAASSDALNFTLDALAVACASGRTEGLYLPLKMKIIDRSTVATDVLKRLGGPESAQVLALEGWDAFAPRGWIDSSNPDLRSFSLRIESWDNPMYNQLEIHGVLRADGSLAVSGLKLRDGWHVTDTVVLRMEPVVASDFLSGRTPWRRMSLPSDSILSTAPENQNFLFCVDKKDSRMHGLVDLKKTRYSISGGSIGEIGFFNAVDNRVYTWRSDSGSVAKIKSMTEYFVSVTGVGGRTTTFKIFLAEDGYGFLMSGNGYSRYFCRAVQNDVFARYYGWNP